MILALFSSIGRRKPIELAFGGPISRFGQLHPLTTLQLIVITVPAAVAEAGQLQAVAVAALGLEGAALGRSAIRTWSK